MNHFAPTAGIRETGRNARAFVKANNAIFWSILKPLLPYLLALNLFDAVITGLFFTRPQDKFSLGAIIAAYFTSFLMISWHRVVIEGPDRFVMANPLKPKINELAFIFAPIGVMIVYLLAVAFISFALAHISVPVMGFAILIFMAGLIYGMLRISFYLPGKAINADMDMKKAWAMTNGYCWKLFAANWCAIWRIMLLALLYLIVLAVIAGVSNAFIFHGTGLAFMLMLFVLQVPMIIYLGPLMAALGVTVLSNYYLIAVNNRAAPTSPPV